MRNRLGDNSFHPAMQIVPPVPRQQVETVLSVASSLSYNFSGVHKSLRVTRESPIMCGGARTSGGGIVHGTLNARLFQTNRCCFVKYAKLAENKEGPWRSGQTAPEESLNGVYYNLK